MILLLVVMLAVLSLHAPGTVGPTPAQAAANPWEFGPYRPVTSQTGAASLRPTTRAIVPTLKLSRTAVQRPQVAPGEVANLIAEYEVSVPQGTVEVKETRIIRFEGQQLAKLEKLVSLTSGPAGSTVALKVPPDAAPGLYTVTTTIELRPVAEARGVARASDGDQAHSMFRVVAPAATPAEPPAGASVAPAATPAAPAAGASDAPARFRLWTDKTQHKIGDAVRLFFQANRDGYVTLVNVGTSGKITILYPNTYTPNHAVKGEQTYSVPGAADQYELTLSGPEGVELVYALFTTAPTQFVEGILSKEAFAPVNDKALSLTRDINLTVKKLPLKEQATAVLEIEVTR